MLAKIRKSASWWVNAEWPVWRLVLDEKASLAEIDQHWSLDDVLDANEALDLAADIDEARKSRADSPG